MCIGVATWYFAGASSAGGIVALVLKRSNGRIKHRDADKFGDADWQRDMRGRPELPLNGDVRPAAHFRLSNAE
jgi:hypothetical protein